MISLYYHARKFCVLVVRGLECGEVLLVCIKRKGMGEGLFRNFVVLYVMGRELMLYVFRSW